MSNILWKNFHLCFSKLKCLPPPPQPSDNHHPPLPPPEDYSVSAVPAKNLNSIYDVTTTASSDQTLLSSSNSSDDVSSDNSSSSSDSAALTLPDLASAYASNRFFFSSPGRSNSIIDSPPLPEPAVTGMGGFTVQKYSSEPYGDFRRSMLEMVEANKEMMKDESINDNNNNNWEYLHELLLYYLALNPKHTHKFIIGAFSDIVVLLMSRPPLRPPSATPGKSKKPGGWRQRSANYPPRPNLV